MDREKIYKKLIELYEFNINRLLKIGSEDEYTLEVEAEINRLLQAKKRTIKDYKKYKERLGK